MQKQFEGQKSEVSSLTKDREKLQKDIGRLEAEVIELKEMVGFISYVIISYTSLFCLGRRDELMWSK